MQREQNNTKMFYFKNTIN